MKNLAISISLLFAFVIFNPLYSQDIKQDKETRKQEKKEQIQREYQITKSVLESKQFVLEARWLGNQYGERIPVTSNINFIMVDSSRAVIQVGSNSGLGSNGVGGITTDGQLTSWELNSNDKKNSFNLRMNITTNLGMYDVLMNISADGNATATLKGLRRGQLVYTGSIVPMADSYVYQGSKSY